MGEPRPVVDVIADQVVERIRSEFEARIGAVVDQAQTEAQRVLADLISTDHLGIPYSSGNDPVSPRADARDRARRTLVQGAAATLLSVAFVAFGQAIVADGFDFTDAGDWKIVGGTVFTAVVMSVLAYVQRIVNPPKGS